MSRQAQRLAFFLLFFVPITLFAQQQQPGSSTEAREGRGSPLDRDSPERAKQVMEALAAAYPAVEKAEFVNNDWTVLMRGKRYYYSGGRILPEELKDKAAQYSPHPFYNYRPGELPAWKEPSAEESKRYKDMGANRRRTIARSTHFFDTLWQSSTRAESERHVKPIIFLGKEVKTHEWIHAILKLVEGQIRAAAQTDPEVSEWVNNISTMESWNWRTIADSQSRSFHAYGVAIDILPKSLRGKETYWLWASQKNIEWWNVSYERRFHPPAAVINAFEANGFVWGGKWLFFDTMHFEYRPEILQMKN